MQGWGEVFGGLLGYVLGAFFGSLLDMLGALLHGRYIRVYMGV